LALRERGIITCAYGEHEMSGKGAVLSRDLKSVLSNSFEARCNFFCRESSRYLDFKKAADYYEF
jgi:hypothetical protein